MRAVGVDWTTFEATRWLGTGLDGKRLLVVGPGRIGQAVARRAEGFGMDVVFAGRDDDLHVALAGADVVSLHAPLTDATRGLIDAAALRAMPSGALLVNTARGPLVDPVALADALRSGHLGGAGLDVTDPEPLPPGDPLLEAPNLLVLPHIGSATREARAAMTRLCVENLRAGLAGEPLPHPA
jgi:glyoxylate reductase